MPTGACRHEPLQTPPASRQNGQAQVLLAAYSALEGPHTGQGSRHSGNQRAAWEEVNRAAGRQRRRAGSGGGRAAAAAGGQGCSCPSAGGVDLQVVPCLRCLLQLTLRSRAKAPARGWALSKRGLALHANPKSEAPSRVETLVYSLASAKKRGRTTRGRALISLEGDDARQYK